MASPDNEPKVDSKENSKVFDEVAKEGDLTEAQKAALEAEMIKKAEEIAKKIAEDVEVKWIKPYNEDWSINGSEWAKATRIIEDIASKEDTASNARGQLDTKIWRCATAKIFSPNGQVSRMAQLRDGGSWQWTLKNKMEVKWDIWNHRDENGNTERGYVTVQYPDESEETFNPEGTKVRSIWR